MLIYFYCKAFAKPACILFLATIFAGYLSYGQAPKTKYKITGYTSQKTGKARLLLYTNQSQFVPFDSTDIKNGTFTFSGVLDEPKSFQLLIGNKGRILFVGNENLVVNDRHERTSEISVTGSALTSDYDFYFNRWIAPLINRLQTVNQKLDSLDATHQKEIDSLTRLQSSLFNYVPDSSAVFIRQHPSSFVSLYLLSSYLYSFNTQTITTLFGHLDIGLKRYPSAQLIQNKINSGSQSGAKCPSFSARDETGQIITLQSFKGTYLLIDFWASWCTPCVKELPVIQKASERFQYQNFIVLTASLDNDSTAWKAAIQKFHLGNFKNIFLPHQFSHPMALQFGVSSIPRMILVDPDGNIIESNIEGEKLNRRLEKIFTISTTGDEDVASLQMPSSIKP